MISTRSENPVTPAQPAAPERHADTLRRQESHYWYLLAGICIMTTVGLAFAMAPLIDDRVTTWWPWANTHIVLVLALSLSTALLVTYVTAQKRKNADIRRRLEGLAEESERRARQNAARLRALLNVSRMMGSLTKLESLFDSITTTCVEVFECQQASLMVINDSTRRLEIRAATGHAQSHVVKKVTVKIGEGIAGWVAQKQKPLILNSDTDPSQYPGLQLKDPSIAAAMVVPIVLRDELVGVLNVSTRVPGSRYNEDDLQALLVFAENAGTCIRHTEHVEWMRKSLHDTMERAAKTPAHKANEALTHP
jgi:transcriptional regulator with GAF, ATPase, and Fis domain